MKTFLTLIAIFLFAATVFGQTNYKTYHNERFDYWLTYPRQLFPRQELSFNGDGGRFTAQDNRAELSVWAHYNAELHTLREEFDEDLKNHGDAVTYRTLLKNGYVISGIKDDKIFYQKTLYHKFRDVDVFYSFTIEYDKSEREKFDPIVQKIARSFRFNPQADV